MALGWILHMRICNQEIGVGDRYTVAPQLMPGEGWRVGGGGGGGLGSIRKQLPHADITFNLLMHRGKGVEAGICRLLRSRDRSFLHVLMPRRPGPFQQHSRQTERREPKSSYLP